jgi:hypothetical protein
MFRATRQAVVIGRSAQGDCRSSEGLDLSPTSNCYIAQSASLSRRPRILICCCPGLSSSLVKLWMAAERHIATFITSHLEEKRLSAGSTTLPSRQSIAFNVEYNEPSTDVYRAFFSRV